MELNKLIAEIDKKYKILNNCRPLTQSELARLMDDFSIVLTYNSNAIEGSTLTLRETDLVLRGLTIDKKPLADHMAAVGHKEAFDYVCDLVKEKAVLSESLIKQIHSLVLMGRRRDSGVYRTVPVTVGGVYTPVQPYLIEPNIHLLLDEYKSDTSHIVMRLARFHIEFERIHPFIDGNGRTGRLLVNFELMKNGYPPIDVKYADTGAYYEAFEEYQSTATYERMALLFAGYLNEQMEQYLKVLDIKNKCEGNIIANNDILPVHEDNDIE